MLSSVIADRLPTTLPSVGKRAKRKRLRSSGYLCSVVYSSVRRTDLRSRVLVRDTET